MAAEKASPQFRQQFILLLFTVSLCVFMLGDQLKTIPQNCTASEDVASAASVPLVSTCEISFQSVEAAAEADAVHGTGTLNNQQARRSSSAQHLRLLLCALILVAAAIRMLSDITSGFPIQNALIHSRTVVLFYIERQDGMKILS